MSPAPASQRRWARLWPALWLAMAAACWSAVAEAQLPDPAAPAAAAGATAVPQTAPLALWTPSGPLTSSDLPDSLKYPRTLAILTIKSQLVALTELFSPEPPRRPASQAEPVEALLAQLLSAEPYVLVRDVAEVRRLLGDDPVLAAVAQSAQQTYRLGLELYLSLAPARAADKLTQAVRAYRETLHDIFDPRPLADAQFMLGVALVDSGRATEGHIALKDAFALQPDRRFRANFYPPMVSAALQSALTDYLQTADPFRAYGDAQRLAQVARRLGVASLVTAALRAADRGPELWVGIFSAQRRTFEAELRVPLSEVGDKLQPFLTRWLACTPVVESRPVAPRRDTVRLDTSAVYAPFLRQPTRRAFHSLGFAVGVAHEFRSNLEWFGRLSLQTSLSDPYRDLLGSFNSVRLVSGLGATVRTGPLRLFAQAGLDAHLLGNFQASADPDCKLFGTQHPLCDRTQILDLDQRVLVGVNAALGAQLHLGRDFLLSLRLSAASYFLPLDGTDRLNLPVGAELGLGYRL